MVSARMAIVSGHDILYSWKQRLFICFLCIVLTYVGKMLIYMNNEVVAVLPQLYYYAKKKF